MPGRQCEYVVVVDDEEAAREACRAYLEELVTCRVSFTSGTKALAAFRDDPQRFDAMITDERMPRNRAWP